MIPLRRLPRLLPPRPSVLLRPRPLHPIHLLRTSATLPTPPTAPSHPPTTPSIPPSAAALPDVYTPPTTGLISKLPPALIPYAELTRLDKPAGTYYLLLPCLFSTVLAATLTTPITPLPTVLYTSSLFTAGAFIMRGAGCTINDLWDRNIDPHITRTRFRPLARRAVTPAAALSFTAVQLLAGLGILLQFPTAVVWSAIPSLVLVAAYPAMKRITHYPQVVLGAAFSWGALLGFPALGLSLMDPAVAMAAACLYTSNIAWTVLYDTVYALQDVDDDRKAGVKSTAVAHDGRGVKRFLGGLGVLQVGLLAAAGCAAGAGPVFYVWSCGGAALGTAWMIGRLRPERREEGGEWFRWCAWAVGGCAILGGLGGEYVWRRLREGETVEEIQEELTPVRVKA